MVSIGVDGCKAGWSAVRIGRTHDAEVRVFASIAELWKTWCDSADIVLIDVPIGLEDREASRHCDREARGLLRAPRASSVFNPPVRSALAATSWSEAADLNHAASGKRLPQQTWGIFPKILEVDGFLRADQDRQVKVREMHPEVLFFILNEGQPLAHNKKRTIGINERLSILEPLFLRSREVALDAFRKFPRRIAQRDDVMDALCGAVTGNVYGGELETLPQSPQRDRFGLSMEMVVPPLTES